MISTTLRRRAAASLTAALAAATLATTALPASAAPPAARATDDSCPAGKTPDAGFDDTDGTTHDASIDCVVAWGIAKGVTTTEYRPAVRVQRDQMATFIANVLEAGGVTLPSDPPNAFSDDDNNVHEKNINALADLGIVKGDSDGNYNPTDPVQRDQMATFLNGAHAAITGAALSSTEDFFSDDDDNVHEGNINGVASQGITGGNAAGDYAPKDDVSRGAMGSFIARQLDLLTETGFAAPPFLGPALRPDPMNTRNFTPDTYTVTFTVLDDNLDPVANAPVDIHVIEQGKAACDVTAESDDNSTGSTACTIDALDPLTDSQGRVTHEYDFVGTVEGERVHRVLAFTDAVGVVYTASSGLKGEAISRWVNPPASVQIVDQQPATATYGSQATITTQVVDDNGVAVPIADQKVIFTVTRGQSACSTSPVGGTQVHGPATQDTDGLGRATFTYVGPADPDPTEASETVDCLIATLDTNQDGTRQFSEPGEGETRTYSDDGGTPTPGAFEVAPDSATIITSGTHSVSATVRDTNGALLAGKDVLFRVYRNNAAPNSSSTTAQQGYRTTDANGVATFVYIGPGVSADDLIVVCLDEDRDGCGGFATIGGTLAPQEPDTTEQVAAYWVEVAASSTGAETYDGDILAFSTTADRIDFEDGAKNYRVSYDAGGTNGDTFVVDGNAATVAQFEAALAEGATLSVNYKPGGVSTFTLTT